MEFDNKTYIPVLRWKPAEKKAYLKLFPSQRKAIVSIIEIIKIKKDTHLEIKDTFGSFPFFIDFHHLYKTINNDNNESLYNISNYLSSYQRNFILVINFDINLNNDNGLMEQTKKILNKRNIKELAFRINATFRQSYVERKINHLLDSLNLKVENVHLLIDHQVILEKNFEAMSIADMNLYLPYINRWKTFSVIGSSFPKDLSEFKKNDIYYIDRLEWLNYKIEIDNKIKRIPTFGDYTIQYGNYVEPPNNADFSASIRYTLEDSWKIMRGESAKKAGFEQWPAQAQLLIDNNNEFKGNSFSAGDKYIFEIANGICGPGNPATWLEAGINHHIALTTEQIINFF